MHILYLYSEITIKGGTDKILVEKANYLANHNYEVTIVTESQMDRPLSFELDSSVCHIDLGLDFNKQYSQKTLRRIITYSLLMYKYKKLLSTLLVEKHPDIVISTLGRNLSILTNMTDGSIKIGEAHTTKNHLRSLHLMEKKGGFSLLLAKYMRWQMSCCVSKLDALVLLTKNDEESWYKITKTYVIPNPISFYPKEKAKLNSKRVIMVGRFNDAKGYDYLIPAWCLVHKQHPDWKLNVYGSGELHDDVARLIKEKKMVDTIILNEPTDHIMEKYLESSICVLSSRYEGFSLVILEAMACGVPVVSFDCPYGPRNIIKNGEDGLLVNYLDVNELAASICKLIENHDLRKRMGDNARKNILRFSKDSVMKQWELLFSKLVEHE